MEISKNRSRDDADRKICAEIIYWAKVVTEATGHKRINLVPGQYTHWSDQKEKEDEEDE